MLMIFHISRWEYGDWSQCTRSCGGGIRYRTVHCWRMIIPGLDSSVSNSLCNETESPPATEQCAEEPCGPQWETSDWSEVSLTLGHQLKSGLCHYTLRPIGESEGVFFTYALIPRGTSD